MQEQKYEIIGFTIYNREEPQMHVWWQAGEFLKAYSEWLTDKRHIKIPKNLYPENINFKAVLAFCESRQPPRTRYDIDYILKRKYKMTEYLPVPMCRLSRGVTHADDLWMLFDGQEKVEYASISVR